ncbi:DNA-3-methyladenine glycosylase 2 family protein, partial [Agromyces binzhouensis]|uniref:DNA-3-methyladenine glycosylase family protein n=1 Tax=Agromyces binzhouensis TaxID=1817495 RepID=UPI0013EA1C77
VGQQVSAPAARTALTRLAADLGETVELAGRPRTLFPTAAVIAEHGADVLRGPAARIRTIIDVCGRLASGDLVVAPERERGELRSELLAVPGIGPWTAGYLAMRVTREPDELLVSDLALRNGAARLGLPSDAKALAARGTAWAPWRSYASMHLWRIAASALST